MINFIFHIFYNDAPEPWQIGFQDSASPAITGISDLHDDIFFYLMIISIGVFYVLSVLIFLFNNSNMYTPFLFLAKSDIIFLFSIGFLIL